jgi:hypothetical protein
MGAFFYRADVRRPLRAVRTSAFAFLLLGAGCRQHGTDPVDAVLPPPVLSFAVNDSLWMDRTALDDFGGTIPGSLRKVVWRVAGVNGTFDGASGVTTIVETSIPPGGPDTLRFRFLASGDIYQHGFFARILKRRNALPLRAQWDLIGGFSLPIDGTWRAGVLDSLGDYTVQGKVVDNTEYYDAHVNGVETAFRCSSVELSGIDFYYLLTVAGAPATLVRFREETSTTTAGEQRALTSLRMPRP